jgi:hypothetical protein
MSLANSPSGYTCPTIDTVSVTVDIIPGYPDATALVQLLPGVQRGFQGNALVSFDPGHEKKRNQDVRGCETGATDFRR